MTDRATTTRRMARAGAAAGAAVLLAVLGGPSAIAATYPPPPPSPTASTVPPSVLGTSDTRTVAGASGSDEGSLPLTGGEVLTMAGVGAGVLAAGGVLVVASRRRHGAH